LFGPPVRVLRPYQAGAGTAGDTPAADRWAGRVDPRPVWDSGIRMSVSCVGAPVRRPTRHARGQLAGLAPRPARHATVGRREPPRHSRPATTRRGRRSRGVFG
jgi:hypothetical protein